jgi:uncharacterized protein DUF3303
MPLFVAYHRHAPDSCPAAGSGVPLLAHVSAATAACYGVAIEAEAVIEAGHRLVLIVEAADRERVEAFMAFFARYGGVAVLPACTSEAAVERGGCMPRLDSAKPPAGPPGAVTSGLPLEAPGTPG